MIKGLGLRWGGYLMRCVFHNGLNVFWLKTGESLHDLRRVEAIREQFQNVHNANVHVANTRMAPHTGPDQQLYALQC